MRDSVDDFTAGSGDNARTFWAQLCAATPILARRSAREVEARHRSLAGAAHPSPPTLEEWSRAADGQFSGNLGGRTVWLTAALEGRFAGDPRAPPAGDRAVAEAGGFVEALGGRVYELGAPAPSAGALTDSVASSSGALADSAPSSRSESVSSQAGTIFRRSFGSTALVALMWLGVGFGAGKIPPATSSSPPPPPLEARTVVPRAGTATPTPKATALSQEPLTLQEKRQRQELRIEKDKLALELRRWQIKQDELQIKQDEQRLGELRRMETERGGETVDAGVTQGAKRQDLESP